MRPFIAAYYFPNYHNDARNALVHGAGWTEWELMRHASPRYLGHHQPRTPLWGEQDEADPRVMAQKIAAAADHGIDAFLFDWYYYDDGPFLERALEKGFFGAENRDRLKFAVMWANHDWTDIHPAKAVECARRDYRLLYPGTVKRETFEEIVAHTIEVYFRHPCYWLLDGAPYYSIYDLPALVRSLGGVEGAREGLAYFRAKTKEAGFPDLHLNQVLWNTGILPGESEIREPGALLKTLGFSSFTSYVWIHHVPLEHFPETSYREVFTRYLDYWDQTARTIDLPYYPNATVGWDSSPRTVQSDTFANYGYPFTPTLSGNTPENFLHCLAEIKARMKQSGGAQILTINAWNEWTEGSYLEPDMHSGLGYLEAIRSMFGASGR